LYKLITENEVMEQEKMDNFCSKNHIPVVFHGSLWEWWSCEGSELLKATKSCLVTGDNISTKKLVKLHNLVDTP